MTKPVTYIQGQVFPNEAGGIKHDQDKPMMDLLDSGFLEDMASVLTFGAKKYAAHNWRKGINVSRTIAAIYRHLGALNRGEDLDPESGCHHEACIAINCQFLNWMLKNRPDLDDRFKNDKSS
jgi:hypothetical protein